MDIRNIRSLKENAAHVLRIGREPKTVVLWYSGITVLIAAVLTVCSYWLSMQISSTGGLRNLGTRAIFSTAQSLLPIVQSVALMCLELGYLHAMMHITRKQYADHTDLKAGLPRLGAMIRLNLIQAFFYAMIAIPALGLSIQIFLLTPWSDGFLNIVLPLAESTTVLNPEIVMDEATLAQATEAMIPMMLLYFGLYMLFLIPVTYRFRMANYALLDAPHSGAFAAIGASMKMTRRNCIALFKLDLSFWWYYLPSFLLGFVSYGDVILPMVGITLPMNETVSYFLFYGLYLAGLFAMTYFLRNKVECTYISAYETICEKPKDSGVVLGNIFDMQ